MKNKFDKVHKICGSYSLQLNKYLTYVLRDTIISNNPNDLMMSHISRMDVEFINGLTFEVHIQIVCEVNKDVNHIKQRVSV